MKKIKDSVLIGSWEEVKAIPLSSITKNDNDTQNLSGLIIRGYETKFGVTNCNGEQYDSHCLDKFINDYFVKNNFNMIVDVNHSDNIDDIVGRVIYIEVNTKGFYFVVYIPKSVIRYTQIKRMLEEGLLQGFSKMGYATDYVYKKDSEDNTYMYIKEMNLMNVSLVPYPANSIAFEKIGETIENGFVFENNIVDESEPDYEINKKKTILKSRKK